jgi:acyl-CoA synthetase (AMP-forming)/AMP-acid ligase II
VGERVTAFILPKPGRSVPSEEIKVFLKSRLSPFKVPKKHVVIDEFPKGPTGKILKRQLKKRVLQVSGSPGRKNSCK